MEINNLVTQQVNNQLQKKTEDQGDVFGKMLSADGNISTPALSTHSFSIKQHDTKPDLTSINVFSQLVNYSQISEKGKLPFTEFGTSILKFANTSIKEQTFSFNPLQEFNTVIKMPLMAANTKDLIGVQLFEANQIAQTVVESYAWSLLANSELSQHSTFQFVTPEKNWLNNAIDITTKSSITTSSKASVAVATTLQRGGKTSNNTPTSNTTFILDKKNNRIKTTATSSVMEPSLRQFEMQMSRVSFYLNEEDKRSKLVIRDYFDASLYSENGLRELIGSLEFFNISTDEIKLNGYVIKGKFDD